MFVGIFEACEVAIGCGGAACHLDPRTTHDVGIFEALELTVLGGKLACRVVPRASFVVCSGSCGVEGRGANDGGGAARGGCDRKTFFAAST